MTEKWGQIHGKWDLVRVCTTCEPARHASHASRRTRHASYSCVPCESYKITLTSRLESFSLISTCFFFINVNYETNLFKGFCGVTPVFLVSRLSMLYSLRWLSVSLWKTLAVLPAKDTVIYAGCYASITLTDGCMADFFKL